MKKIHLKHILIVIMTLIFLLSGCGVNRKPLMVSYDLNKEPQNLDPQTASDIASITVINNIFEGLFAIDANGNLENRIALSYTKSPDGLKYEFKLRDDVNWNYGKNENLPVTANDFVFGFQRLLNIDTNSPQADLYFCIRNAKAVHSGMVDANQLGVSAKDDTTLQIELEYANPYFLNLLTYTYAMPCNEEFFLQTKGKYGLEPDTIIANGPFTLYSWEHNSNIKLYKSESYYESKDVTTDAVTLWINSLTRKEKEDGKVIDTVERLLDDKTLAGLVDGFDIKKLDGKAVNTQPIETSTWGIVFNQNNKQLKNRNTRLAIATAFDRKTYTDILPESLAAATAIVPHDVVVGDKTFREYAGETITQQYNPEKAFEYYKKAIDELNARKINGIKLIMPASEKALHSDFFSYPSQVLQRDLGIFMSVEELEESEYKSRLRSGDYDCALVELEVVSNSIGSILGTFQSDSPQNYYGYANINVDLLFKQVASQTDIVSISQCYKKIEQAIIDDVAFIPMYYKTDYFAVSQDIKGLNYQKQTGVLSFKDVVRS